MNVRFVYDMPVLRSERHGGITYQDDGRAFPPMPLRFPKDIEGLRRDCEKLMRRYPNDTYSLLIRDKTGWPT